MIVSIPINYICNLNCNYCYFDKSENKKINLKILDLILKKIDLLDIKGYLNLFFDMKEPLLNQDLLIEVIEYIKKYLSCKNYGINIVIFTNGTIKLKNKLKKYLINNKKIIRFHISLDGIHNFSRGINRKQFINIINNILLIKKFFNYNIGYVIDDYTVSLNINELKNIYNFFIKLDFLNVKFYRKRIIGEKETLNNYSKYLDGYLNVFFFFFKESLKRKNNEIPYIEISQFYSFFNLNYSCGALKKEILGFDLDGNKHFCSEGIGQSEKGFDNTMKKVDEFKIRYCKNCKIKSICNSPCILEGRFKCLSNFKSYNYITSNKIKLGIGY